MKALGSKLALPQVCHCFNYMCKEKKLEKNLLFKNPTS
jgi:hypothetical protein